MKTIKLFSITLFIALISMSFIVQASRSGNSRQTRTVSEFHGISVSTGIDLFLTQKNTQEVSVEAGEHDLDHLVTEVEDGILKIYMKDNSMLHLNWNQESPKVYVSFKTLDKLKASAGSDVASQSVLNLDKLDIDASSGSDVKLELNASELNVESSSGSDINLKGKANFLRISASSASDIKAADFQTKKCNADASSGSDIRIYVTEQLEAHASSGSDISYSGNPAHKDIKESSGGDVHQR
ncbi:MAG TPA: head GIN domain-containing protein [Prolixibacteraceae bacterium]|jgi:hypothetical protein